MSPSPASSLRAVALNCSLKSTPEASSTERMVELISDQLAGHDVETTATFRIVDEGVRFGVTSDEGDGDGWPAIRTAILDAQILVLATPIWLGHPSSVCQMVLERLDAFISETDDKDRPIAWDRVAVVGVVGNEDGAHHVAAEVMQGLNDVGFTVSPGGAVYWVGEAMGSVDFKDLDEIPSAVRETAVTLASNAAHTARLLAAEPYPAMSS
jgi:multimeric flavodoxin WrbA